MSSEERPTSYGELAELLEVLPLLIREARRARGLSGRQAAKQMGVNFTTLGRIENGAGYNSEVLLPILQWLDLTAKEATKHE